MSDVLALAPTFSKGIAAVVAAFILFVGSVYVMLTAVFGLRMGYLILAVAFFGWMIIYTAIWAFPVPGTTRYYGPRGTEPHWAVFASGTNNVRTKYSETLTYPGGRWQGPNSATKSSVDTVASAIQAYLRDQAARQLDKQGKHVCTPTSSPVSNCFRLDPTTFVVQDVEFVSASPGPTELVAAHAFYSLGGPELTVYAYRDPGNVPVYSVSFFLASLLGFAIHVPLLDRAEKSRKAILTGGTAPPWYGPA